MLIIAGAGFLLFVLACILTIYLELRGIWGIPYGISLSLAMWGIMVAVISSVAAAGVYFLQHF